MSDKWVGVRNYDTKWHYRSASKIRICKLRCRENWHRAGSSKPRDGWRGTPEWCSGSKERGSLKQLASQRVQTVVWEPGLSGNPGSSSSCPVALVSLTFPFSLCPCED